MKDKISFVIPCYKSQDTILFVLEQIKKVMIKDFNDYDYEVVLVNDGSPDQLHSVIMNKVHDDNVKYIELAKNFGQHNAVMAGLHSVTGSIIVCLDDDNQSPVEELPKLIHALNSDVDVVYAKYASKKHSLFRNFGSKINDYMLVKLLGKPKNLYISSFFVMKSYVKDEIIKYQNPYPYLGGLILRVTNKIVNVETNHHQRMAGTSGYDIKKLLKLWVNGLTNFSIRPLRFSILCSFILIFCAFVFGIYVIVNKFLNPLTPLGWSSTILVILAVGSILTLLLGIIGEYLGRIYISINNIPQYVIRRNSHDKEKKR